MAEVQVPTFEGNLLSNRLVGLPIVSSVIDYLSQSYQRSNVYQSLVNKSLSVAEGAVGVIVSKSKLFLSALEQLVSVPDHFGGMTLDAMAANVPVVTNPTELIRISRKVMGQLRTRGGEVVEAMADKVPVIVRPANVIQNSREVMGQLRTRSGEFVEAMTTKVPVFTRPTHVGQYLDQLKTRALAIREPGTYAYNMFRRVITHSGVDVFYGKVIVSYASAKESLPNKIKVLQASVQNELNLISERYSRIRNLVKDFKKPAFVNVFVAVKSFSGHGVAMVLSRYNSLRNQLSGRMVSELSAVQED